MLRYQGPSISHLSGVGREGPWTSLALDPRVRHCLSPLRDPLVLNQLTVNHEAGTIVWPNGADLDPDVLYELAHGGEGESREGEEKSRLKPRLG